MSNDIIEIKDLTTRLGGVIIHEKISLNIPANKVIGIAGGSGSGKTTLLRAILMLLKPAKGTIRVFDVDVTKCTQEQAQSVRKRWGVLFQSSALFSSLTVLENVLFPMREFVDFSPALQIEMAKLKVSLTGLPIDAIHKYPAELSGGMKKRAALARAIALDPELLFLDEPTAGLDPKSAADLDDLVLSLKETLGLTVVVITHDLPTLTRTTDKVAFLGDKQVLAYEPMSKLRENTNPIIQWYFQR